ncbi:MAG: ATP-binding protein [Chromatiales bacterium]|jgi:signal transduction histidine kinase
MPESIAYRLPVRRLFWLPLGISAILVLTVLVGLVVVSWRGLERIQPVQAHLAYIGRIQDVALDMEQTLLLGLRGNHIQQAYLDDLRRQVDQLMVLENPLHPATRQRLLRVVDSLTKDQPNPMELLINTLAQLREVLAEERRNYDRMLADVALDNETELRLAVAFLIALPLAGGALLLLVRARIKHPLDDLGDLLVRLAGRDYRPVPNAALSGTAALLQPVFRSYNSLVSRLQELEAQHRAREHTLEQEVRQATEALLEQNRELARAERLAAVGAVSAGLAHELRNPLAGIQMACSKLQRSLGKSDQAARIEAVIGEIKRINGLLTQNVDAARHAPEALERIRLSTLVDEFLNLVRYQVPAGIELQAQVPADLMCLLPVAGLRQALLNLVLNSVQALGDKGHVTVKVQRQDDRLVLSVSDDGPGFPAEMLSVGVRPFATGRSGGTGLGLAMVRRFTRDHNGELELANRQPHGARVSLQLPCTTYFDEGADKHA